MGKNKGKKTGTKTTTAKAEWKDPTPKGVKVTKELELPLDEATHVKLSKERGEKLRAKAALVAEFEEVKDKWNARIKPLTERLSVLDDFVEHGREKKTVTCTMVKNFDQSVIEFWHEGKVVDSRAMTALDRQEQLATRRGRDITQTARQKRDPRMAAAGDDSHKDTEIADVVREETGRKTKRSAVDGPTATDKANGALATVTPLR